MMDYVIFERGDGMQFRPLDYGLLLKSFACPPPAAKLYKETIDGMDGDLDMSEWAGVIRYEDRTVEASFRDMDNQQYTQLLNFVHGRKMKIYHSSDLAHYFEGRCSEAETETQRHVTDIGLRFVCAPYKRACSETVISKKITGSANIVLLSARETVSPTFTASAAATISDGAALYSIPAGTSVIPNLVITDTPKTITVSMTGTLTIKWRDGVL